MVSGHILDSITRHLQHDEASRRALVVGQGLEFTLVHAGGGRVVRHEQQAAQVGPAGSELLEGAHHPRGKTTALEVVEDEDIGEVGKGDVVGAYAAEASQLEGLARGFSGQATVFCEV